MKGLFESLKWNFFVLINTIQNLLSKNGNACSKTKITNFQESTNYIWVFCSTIGEVNACKPLLDQLHKESSKLVFLTDRNCYRESYLNHFPEAIVVELSGEIMEYKQLINKIPPSRFIVCEIPCSAHDAPCRLSYGILRSAKKHGASIQLVNGWLYDYQPSCRMDSIETTLFKKEYIQSFDKITVQTEDVAKKLIHFGVNQDIIKVTGNMKFDCISNTQPLVSNGLTKELLENIKTTERPKLIAGCLINEEEFSELLALFINIKEQHNDLIAVFAPRHPENKDLMEQIEKLLAKSQLHYRYKSQLETADTDEIDILVLDTIGELKAFFSVGDVCYMGQNHNILEPLSFNKPVFTINGWEPTYPSYPVYQVAAEKALIHCSETYSEMTTQILKQLNPANKSAPQLIEVQLENLKGATKKNIEWLRSHPSPTNEGCTKI